VQIGTWLQTDLKFSIMGYPILSVTGFAAPAELGSAMATLCGQVLDRFDGYRTEHGYKRI